MHVFVCSCSRYDNTTHYTKKFSKKKKINHKNSHSPHSYNRTASLASRSSDESKSRRGFGSLLRRHTSFGAPDTSRSSGGTNVASPQDNNHD